MKISPLNLKSLAYTLDVEGFRSGPVLARLGLPPLDQMDEDGEWMPMEVFDEMMALAMEETGDPSFALIAGKSMAMSRYGVLTPLFLFAPSLRQVFKDLDHFAKLVVERSELSLEEGERSSRIVVDPLIRGGRSGWFRTEFVATTAMQMLRYVGAGADEVHETTFPYACPPGMKTRYAAAFGDTILFDHPRCSLRFASQVLDRRLITHDPIAYLASKTRAESALAALVARNDVAERVRQWLVGSLPMQPTLHDTARGLGVNARTLRRQLAQFGTTYQGLTDECQAMVAVNLLAEGRLTLKQIAHAVGYSTVSSFHRAFKRWHGVTPIEWKERGASSSDDTPA